MAEAATAEGIGGNGGRPPNSGERLPSFEPPSSVGALRLLRSFRSNVLDAFSAEHYAKLRVSFHLFGREFICLSDPDDIDHVMNAHIDRYQPNVLARRLMEPIVGRGLLMSEGEDWERQHRQLIPFFQPRQIERLIPVFHDVATAAIRSWSSGGVVERNLLVDFRRLTLALIARSLLSIEDEARTTQLADFVTEAERSGALLQWQDIVALAVWSRMPQPRRRLDLAARFRVWIETMLDNRSQSDRPGQPRDMLDALRAGRQDGSQSHADNDEIIDQIATMFTSGFTTTALGTFWTVLALALLPDHQEAVRLELCQGEAAASPDAQSLRASCTAIPFIYEAMRLYPPAYVIAREARQHDQIGDFEIPRGAAVIISPWVVHRHEALWRDPHRFDPERFLDAGRVKTPRAWIAFGVGPRVCIGASFATTEILIILRCLLSRYKIELRGRVPCPIGRVTLTPEFQPLFRLTPL